MLLDRCDRLNQERAFRTADWHFGSAQFGEPPWCRVRVGTHVGLQGTGPYGPPVAGTPTLRLVRASALGEEPRSTPKRGSPRGVGSGGRHVTNRSPLGKDRGKWP